MIVFVVRVIAVVVVLVATATTTMSFHHRRREFWSSGLSPLLGRPVPPSTKHVNSSCESASHTQEFDMFE
jgi:hypothetical protein